MYYSSRVLARVIPLISSVSMFVWSPIAQAQATQPQPPQAQQATAPVTPPTNTAPTTPPATLTPIAVEPAQPTQQPMQAPISEATPAAVPPLVLVPQRQWGLGSTLGGGAVFASLIATTGSARASSVSPALLLPSFDARIFLRSGHSIDISVPILNVLLLSALNGGFVFSADAYYNINSGTGNIRLLAGAGLGFTALALSGGGTTIAGGSIRIPAMIGVEFMTAAQGFGFQLALRPFAELAFAGAASISGSAVGGGVLFVIGFFGYSATIGPSANH